ncbi:hypothetical protein SAMN05216266_102391 [Amycolatopsis marina]|uniref:DUF8129 domain-containing protein n=1 Tax=Amycolatopsis marina TaxID=490629 RepID=A0A1I0X2X0_9PSEU|nr:hypothetical protein [Amycolatopsis marina]SFA94728.1 hypothetical protein SAMN05216266_102391 [Amycolatopsis marina]
MLEHDNLPLPDYDHLPQSSLMHRIRSLSEDQLETLLEYEEAHANRVAVVEMLQARRAELREGATPSAGDQSVQPENAGPPAGGSRVSPDSAATPSAPPRHGVYHESPSRQRP